MNEPRLTFPTVPTQQTAAAEASGGNDIDPIALAWALWRGKFWLLIFVILGAGYGYHSAYVEAVPTFRSTATVALLSSRNEEVDGVEASIGALRAQGAALNTELEVIRSRSLLRKLVNELALQEDPEFNPYLREPRPGPTRANIRAAILDRIRTPDPKGPPPTAEQAERWATNILRSKIGAALKQGTYVLQISATTQNRVKSARIANALAQLYILNQIEVKFEATEQATAWLSERASELQTTLEASEEKIKDFTSQSDLVNSEALEALNRQLKELRDRALEGQALAVDAGARLEALEAAQASGDRTEMARLANDPTLTRALSLLQANPESGSAGFDTRFGQIVGRTQLDLDRAQSQQDLLETSVADLQARIENQSNDLVTLQQLQREAEANRLIYEFYLNRLKETSVQQGIQQADSRVLSEAIRGVQVAPNRRIIILQAVLAAFALGSVLIIARELMQNGFRTAADLESRTGLTVLGQIPQIPSRRRINVLQYLVEKPTSAAAEAIRNMRTSILMSNVDTPPQVIMVTSSIPGEGKTTVSLALTQNLSGLSKKVLLIEGDIRRRVFSEYFDVKNPQGLLSILAGENTLAEAVSFREEVGADVLFGEKSKVNAADVFSSQSFADFLSMARQQYDYIIIDTPPVLVVPDARVIGRQADAIVYGVKWDSTSRRQVTEGLKSFESVKLKVTGLVLGQISPKGMKRYGYGDSYGAYSRYGKGYYDS